MAGVCDKRLQMCSIAQLAEQQGYESVDALTAGEGWEGRAAWTAGTAGVASLHWKTIVENF